MFENARKIYRDFYYGENWSRIISTNSILPVDRVIQEEKRVLLHLLKMGKQGSQEHYEFAKLRLENLYYDAKRQVNTKRQFIERVVEENLDQLAYREDALQSGHITLDTKWEALSGIEGKTLEEAIAHIKEEYKNVDCWEIRYQMREEALISLMNYENESVNDKENNSLQNSDDISENCGDKMTHSDEKDEIKYGDKRIRELKAKHEKEMKELSNDIENNAKKKFIVLYLIGLVTGILIMYVIPDIFPSFFNKKEYSAVSSSAEVPIGQLVLPPVSDASIDGDSNEANTPENQAKEADKPAETSSNPENELKDNKKDSGVPAKQKTSK